MVSRCCKSEAITDENFYNCLNCYRPCDMILESDIRGYLNERRKRNESKSENKIKVSFD